MIAADAKDARDVLVEGPSGILNVCAPWLRPIYQPGNKRILFSNGCVGYLYSAADPEELRGPEFEKAWCDEFAKWPYQLQTWDNLQFGMRQGKSPQVVITTTPKPTQLFRKIVNDPSTKVTRGSTYDNAINLSARFIETIKKRYEGTRLGRQELDGVLLDDAAGALWTYEMIDAALLPVGKSIPDLDRVVIAIDPSGTKGDDDRDAVGIVAVGLGVDGILYVLEDATMKGSPHAWAKCAIDLFHRLKADVIVVETNFGGAMIDATIRSVWPAAPLREVSASRGKHVRAEPVAALYEQNKVVHCKVFAELEEQMTLMNSEGYQGHSSPNNLDALVWACTELMPGYQIDIVSISSSIVDDEVKFGYGRFNPQW